jgi:hypothetical protein
MDFDIQMEVQFLFRKFDGILGYKSAASEMVYVSE